MDRSLDKVIDQPLLQWLPLPTTQNGLSDVAQLYLYDTSSFELDWKTMRHVPWRFFYMDYLHLQQDIGNLTFSTLNRRLETEWNKVYDFFILKKGEIERRLACCTQNDTRAILLLMNEIHHLHRFARLNYIAFLRLVVEFDKLGATINGDTLGRIMINKPFWDDINVLYDFLNRVNFLSVFPTESSFSLKHQDSSISINPSKQSFFSAVENFSTSLSITTAQVFPPIFVSTHPVSFYQNHHETDGNKDGIKNEAEIMHYPKLPPLHHPLSPTASISTLGSCETASSSMGNTAISDVPMASRSVRKYWVHPDHLVEVMLYLSHHTVIQNKDINPSYTYSAVNEVGHPLGIKSKLAAMNPLGLHRQIVANPSQTIDSKTQVKITTLHMDTPDLKGYAERIVGQPLNNNASTNNECVITRARWYGTTNDTGDDDTPRFVALEQKAYHRHSAHHRRSMGHKGLGKIPQYSQETLFYKNKSRNTLLSSYWVQQRLWLKSKRLSSWIQSKYSCKNTLSKISCQYRASDMLIEDPQHKESIKYNILEMEKEIHEKDKLPMLKTTQRRTVYGTPNNKIFITVDTDISMMKCSPDESKKQSHGDNDSLSIMDHGIFSPGANDKKYPYINMASNDIVRFPYCVIQISEETTPSTPTSSNIDKYCDMQWLDDLCESPLLEPVHDFSTYLHGVATLLSEKVHVFPSWMSKIENMDIRRSIHGSLLTERKKSHERGNSNDQSVSSITSQSSFSRSEYNAPWSSTTIATMVTYCDDDGVEENDENSTTKDSHHLSPVAVNEHRKSFDSYCSFDHPTSSNSDPTNCRSCVGKKKDMSYDPSVSKLLSVVRILWPNKFTPEREPLFQQRNTVMNYQATCYDDIESAYGVEKYKSEGTTKGVPRATLLTTVCIMISLGASLLFYTFVVNI